MNFVRTIIISLFIFLFFQIYSQSENEFIKIDIGDDSSIEISENISFSNLGAFLDVGFQAGSLISKEIPVTIADITPFLAFSFTAKGSGIKKNNLTFFIRTKDHDHWTSWDHIHHGHEFERTAKAHFSELLFFDKQTKSFQLKVIFKNTEEVNPVLETININLFSPGEITENQTDSSSFSSSFVDCYCPLPDFISRTEWNCPDGQEPSCTTPIYTDVTHLVVHHSASSNTSGNWPAVVLSFWDYHVNGHGWCDIGYNWLVDPDGNLYEGRGGGDNVQGAHFSCVNSNTMGVCMIGNFMEESPTIEAKEKLQKLLAWKCCDNSLNPLAIEYHPPSDLYLSTICGHKDANPSPNGCGTTNCPGNVFYPQLDEIRTNVNELMNTINCGGLLPPPNDFCQNAQIIEYHQNCEFIIGDVSGATPSGIPQPTCSEYSGFPALEDVWFSFVADSTALGIKVQSSEFFDAVLVLYDGCMGEELSCSDHGGGLGDMEFIDYHQFIIGDTYYVRVYHYGGNFPLTPTFEICLSDPFYYPVADFYASSNFGSVPFEIDFFDQSINEPNSWSWNFEGGNPEISNEQNPENILYEEPGIYDVSLFITNKHGEHKLIKKNYIDVNPNGIAQYNNNSVFVYPNPTTGIIKYNAMRRVKSIQVLNQFGQVVISVEKSSQSAQIDLSNFSNGIYILQAFFDNEISTIKLIKQ